MRRLFLSLLLLAPAFAGAEDAHVPRFARVQTPAQILDFSTCPKPEYPKSSFRNQESGMTMIRFVVAPTGRLVDATVARSSGFRDLDRAAMTSLSRCLFRPASIDNKPVQQPTFIQYVWSLQ